MSDPTEFQGDAEASVSPWSRATQAARQVWPVLVLATGALVLAGGVVLGIVTQPKPDLDGRLSAAERQLNAADFEGALETLNTKVLPLVDQPWVSDEIRGRYHRLVARSVYLGERSLGIEESVNAQTVLAEYLKAEKVGETLTPEDLVWLFNTNLTLGNEEAALTRLHALPEDASEERRVVLRRMVEWELAKPRPQFDQAIELLGAITSDADLDASDRAWSLARETEIRYGQGYAAEGVARLLQGIMRLEDASKGALAELYTLLGQGYYDLGEYETAKTQLDRALALLGTTEPMTARAQVYMALCEQSLGELTAARDRYAGVVGWAEDMEWELPALIGLAETEGHSGRIEESVAAFQHTVDALLDGRTHAMVTPSRVASSLLDRASDRLDADDPREALRFVLRAEELFSLGLTSPEILATLAMAHEMLAGSLIAEGQPEGEGSSGTRDAEQIAALDPATRERAQRHSIAAAEYYAQHADNIMLSDNEAFVRSLWKAAQAYERGGEYQKAAGKYQEFVSGVPDDPGVTGREGSQAEARFRIARCHQALGQWTEAAGAFSSLIADGELDSGVGQYGPESMVPLAQVYLADDDETNDGEARRLLEEAVSGRLGDEASKYFREALFELGAVHHRAGEHPRAIERLTEAIERYPDDPLLPVLRFRLADALRQAAAEIERSLDTEAMPDALAVELAQTREARLREAMGLFDGVRGGLDAKSEETRTESERVALRNSHFYLGDCAFDLGDYEAAVQHYEMARERYHDDPASLVAMVQIVNAYIAMGQNELARAANERAKRFFAKLPEDAWNDPYLPMSRQDWERWLDSTTKLYGFGNGG